MTKNPFYNAGLAIIYIILIVLVIRGGLYFAGPKDNVLMPMAMLSLFVLSAAIMASIFFYQPAIMFLDNKRKEAVNLFVKTVAVFAASAFVIAILSLVVSKFWK